MALIDRANLLAELDRTTKLSGMLTGRGDYQPRQPGADEHRSSAEPMAVAYAAHRESGLELLVTMATQLEHPDAGIVAAAADAVVRGRALVLDALAGRNRIAFESRDPEAGRLLTNLQRASDRLSNLIVRGPRDGNSPALSRGSGDGARRQGAGRARAGSAECGVSPDARAI